MSLIESFDIDEQGYHPFIIRDSWQVAKLNYSDEQHINNLEFFNMHQFNDRAFALLKGKAVLITIDDYEMAPTFTMKLMKRGTSYNIPKKMIYAVAMEESSEVFIVEKSNTHLNGDKDYSLNEEQLNGLRIKVREEFKK